jgi:multidrug efflux pump subunit AcrB
MMRNEKSMFLSDLPNDADPPSLTKFSLSDLPIMTIGANGKMDEAAFYDLIDKKLLPFYLSECRCGASKHHWRTRT